MPKTWVPGDLYINSSGTGYTSLNGVDWSTINATPVHIPATDLGHGHDMNNIHTLYGGHTHSVTSSVANKSTYKIHCGDSSYTLGLEELQDVVRTHMEIKQLSEENENIEKAWNHLKVLVRMYRECGK